MSETDAFQTAHEALTARIAERNRRRAERLARLGSASEAPAPASPRPFPPAVNTPHAPESRAPSPGRAETDKSAELEEFLRALSGGLGQRPARAPEPPAAVLPFPGTGAEEPQAPAPPPAAEDLDTLLGIGPGLHAALKRAGCATRADLAPLSPRILRARLGPLGHLIPAEAWIAAARGG